MKIVRHNLINLVEVKGELVNKALPKGEPALKMHFLSQHKLDGSYVSMRNKVIRSRTKYKENFSTREYWSNVVDRALKEESHLDDNFSKSCRYKPRTLHKLYKTIRPLFPKKFGENLICLMQTGFPPFHIERNPTWVTKKASRIVRLKRRHDKGRLKLFKKGSIKKTRFRLALEPEQKTKLEGKLQEQINKVWLTLVNKEEQRQMVLESKFNKKYVKGLSLPIISAPLPMFARIKKNGSPRLVVDGRTFNFATRQGEQLYITDLIDHSRMVILYFSPTRAILDDDFLRCLPKKKSKLIFCGKTTEKVTKITNPIPSKHVLLTPDMSDAYNQLKSHPTLIQFGDSIYRMENMNQGVASSAANFQSFADLISSLISKVTKSPSIAYQDDFFIIMPKEKLEGALGVLDEMFAMVGIKFDFSKRMCGKSVDFLGKKITLKQEALVIENTDGEVEDFIRKYSKEGTLQSLKDLQSFLGKPQSIYWGSMPTLVKKMFSMLKNYEKYNTPPHNMAREIISSKSLMSDKIFHFLKKDFKKMEIFVDATPTTLGVVIFEHVMSETRHIESITITLEKKLEIKAAEMLALIIALGGIGKNALVTAHEDNTQIVTLLNKSVPIPWSVEIESIAKRFLKLKCYLNLVYVPSKINLADLLTRKELLPRFRELMPGVVFRSATVNLSDFSLSFL